MRELIWFKYFDMRQQQVKVLAEMSIDLSVCSLQQSKNLVLAHLFHQTADQLHESNPVVDLTIDIKSCLNDLEIAI